jgi:NAD(P)H-dependent FMN reductase
VRENVDSLDQRSDDRGMQKKNLLRNHLGGERSTRRRGPTGSYTRERYVASTTVLVIVGISTRMVSHGLTDAAALGAPNGITLNVFDQLAHVPPHSEASENERLPRPVDALRRAASEANAAMILTDYHGQITAAIHNVIDWLTRRCNHSALHDKPLAVIGPTEDCYSGVWSRHQIEESGCVAETLVIEPFTVTTLCEAVMKLAEQADMTRALRSGQRHEPRPITDLTPEVRLQGARRAASANEFEAGRRRR